MLERAPKILSTNSKRMAWRKTLSWVSLEIWSGKKSSSLWLTRKMRIYLSACAQSKFCFWKSCLQYGTPGKTRQARLRRACSWSTSRNQTTVASLRGPASRINLQRLVSALTTSSRCSARWPHSQWCSCTTSRPWPSKTRASLMFRS